MIWSLRGCWQGRWSLLRLLVALALLIIFVRDLPSSIVRRQWAALPDYDYIGETTRLRQEGRYGEALLVADAGLAGLVEPERDVLLAERARVVEERDSLLRRARAVGRGALTGEGRSLEEVVGAVTADFFVVGDVRDLLIQGAHLAVDGEADEVITALSAVGVLTTVIPEIDWAAAVLKFARKTGRMSKALAEEVVRLCRKALRERVYGPLRELVAHAMTLAEKLGPAGLTRLLKHVDDPADLAKLAQFVERQPHGAFALQAAGADGVRCLTRAAEPVEGALVLAAKKGDGGIAWLRSGRLRLLRPHPLLGLAKATYKGNLPSLFTGLPDWLDAYNWMVIPLLALWALIESRLVARVFRRARVAADRSRRAPQRDATAREDLTVFHAKEHFTQPAASPPWA